MPVRAPSEPTAAAAAPKKLGLRERKKMKARAEIRHHAIRLFLKHGYDATTIEQICDAAELSPSTFFRYFPTKEAVVLDDDFDPIFLEALHRQPRELPPLRALLRAMREALAEIPNDTLDEERARQRLVMRTPELRAALLAQLGQQLDVIAVALSDRSGLPPKDPAVRAWSGALLGAAWAAFAAGIDDDKADYIKLFEQVVEQLEKPLPTRRA